MSLTFGPVGVRSVAVGGGGVVAPRRPAGPGSSPVVTGVGSIYNSSAGFPFLASIITSLSCPFPIDYPSPVTVARFGY